jgi:hypothetical protein
MKINKDNLVRFFNSDSTKAFALFCLVFLLLSGCMTNRKGELTEKGKNFIANHCKGSDSTVTNTEVIFKDTTLYITERGETIYIQNPCDSIKPVVTKKNGIKSSVRQVGRGVVFECEADSLRAVIKLLERKTSIVKKERVVIEKPCAKDHLKSWHYFLMWSGGIALAFLFLKAIRAYFHI